MTGLPPTPRDPEPICEHRSAAGPSVLRVRGTLLASSMQVLRDLGYFERYVQLLDESAREGILSTIAFSWVPIAQACAHYEACDRLGLTEKELSRMGELVARRFAESFFGTLLKTARAAGLNGAWVALAAQPRVWDRMYEGGGVVIHRIGPKDAHMELYGLPLVRYRYFRMAYTSYILSLAQPLVRKLVVRQTAARQRLPDTLALAGSWV